MQYNLLNEHWIPVRRRSGTRSYIAPWQVPDNADDPIVWLDLSRPDFSGSMIQFLIGLYQSATAHYLSYRSATTVLSSGENIIKLTPMR